MIKLKNPCGGPGEEKTYFDLIFIISCKIFMKPVTLTEKVLIDLSDIDIVSSLSSSIHREKSIMFLSLNKFIFFASKRHHEKVKNST